MNNPTPEAVWPFVMAGCNAAEVAEWFGITESGAGWLVMLAKRAHLITGGTKVHYREEPFTRPAM
jgi:hypothetical protein